jgi:cytochrome c oxidase subunit II
VLPTVVVAALLVYGSLQSNRITGTGSEVGLVVEVDARQWQWTFRYLDGDGAVMATTVDSLVMPRGRMVEFRVGSQDVIHSFWIPRLGGKIDAIPGRINRLRLQADQAGAIRGQCAEFCGLAHAHMDFDVHVLEDDAWAAWRSAQSNGRAAGASR